MRITAISTYFDGTGKPAETHQLVAEFDGEYELPGCEKNPAAGVAGRAVELGSVAKELLEAIREGTPWEGEEE